MRQKPAASPFDEVIEFFAHGPSREEIAAFRLSDAAQGQIRALLGRNAAGTLTMAEERELDKIVLLDGLIALIRVRAQRPVAPTADHSDAPHA